MRREHEVCDHDLVRGLVFIGIVTLAACSGSADSPESGAAASASAGSGGTNDIDPAPPDAGLEPWICQAGQVQQKDGTCRPAGIAASECGEGFVHDGVDACNPILPSAPCPLGKMAIPGETTCHEVAACGAGTWGDIATDADTQYVDASFAGASDGTAQKPWSTIGAAVLAAKSGATVAIAAGSYPEWVKINKPLTVWGVCPSKVEVAGPDGGNALQIVPGGGGTTIRGLAVTGKWNGIGLDTAATVKLRQVWIHDTGNLGFYAWSDTGALAQATVTTSLIEGAHGAAILGHGAALEVDGCVMRDMLGNMQNGTGRGVMITPGTSGTVPTLAVKHSLIERTVVQGIASFDAATTIDSTVIRDVKVAPELDLTIECVGSVSFMGLPQSLSITRSFLARCHLLGVHAAAGKLDMNAVTLRDVVQAKSGAAVLTGGDKKPVTATVSYSVADGVRGIAFYISGKGARLDGVVARHVSRYVTEKIDARGVGIAVIGEAGGTSDAVVRGARVEDVEGAGIVINEATATIESARIEGIRFKLDSEPLGGSGIMIGATKDPTAVEHPIQPTKATVISSSIGKIDGGGIDVQGGSAEIRSTRVHDIDAVDAYFGRAIRVLTLEGRLGSATLSHCLLEGTKGIALFVVDASATIDHTIVRASLETKHGYGDSVTLMSFVGQPPATIDISDSILADAARAGLANFGGSATARGSRIDCAAIDLDGEPFEYDLQLIASKQPNEPKFSDLGGNRCGCGATARSCQIKSTHLTPPPNL